MKANKSRHAAKDPKQPFSYAAHLEAGAEFARANGLEIVSGGLRGPTKDSWCCPLGAALMAARKLVAAELKFPDESEVAHILGGWIDSWLLILKAIDSDIVNPLDSALECAREIDREIHQAAA